MKIQQMEREDFNKVPFRKSFMSNEPLFRSLVIIPTEQIHDSGFRCIEFVGVDENEEPVVRMSGCSDVIHIDGIGGYGNWQIKEGMPLARPIEGWSVDCLAKSGYFRLFCNGEIKVGPDSSSFEIYYEPRKDKDAF